MKLQPAKFAAVQAAMLVFITCGFLRAEDQLVGGGATFPAPLYQKWIAAFEAKNPGLPIRYEATGSVDGLKRFAATTLDFAASDIPPDTNSAGITGIQMLPSIVGAVVPVYNLPGLRQDLQFTPEVLAAIFLGDIKKWNDPRIKTLNRGVALPDESIAVFHRSDGSGTTFVLSEFLSKTNEAWKNRLGSASTLAWPAGEGVIGNAGMADKVTATKFSVGYVEFIYAVRSHLSFASVRNPAGKFVRADVDSITAAAKTAKATGDFNISITNADDKEAYPMASFTWLLIPSAAKLTAPKHDRLLAFLRWALLNGQRQAEALGYVPLPADLALREQKMLEDSVAK